MIYLVGNRDKRLQKIIATLEKSGLDCTAVSWPEIGNKSGDVFLILTQPEKKEALDELIRKNTPCSRYILIGNDISDYPGSVLQLPADTSAESIAALCNWIRCSKKSHVCNDTFASILRGTAHRIFFIDAEENIIATLPDKGLFLGYQTNELLLKNFEELFGIPIAKIPGVNRKKDRIQYLTDRNGREISVSTIKLPEDRIEAFGIPEGTSAILFLSEIDELGYLKEKNERLASKQTYLLERRAEELASANDILQSQALELQNALEDQETRNKQIVEELTLASELQKSLLPKEFPHELPINFTHKYVPYAYIGGDFFDVIRLAENKIGILIADVSGHGVAAAFITAMLKSAFSVYAANETTPSKTLSKLNNEFAETIHTEHYITAFYLIIDTETMHLAYCNAGHPKQLLFRAGGEVEELTTMGFFIGMFEGTEYEDKELQLFPGDRLFLFTDGIIEITNAEGIQFGRENIQRVVSDNAASDLDMLSGLMLSELMMYMTEESFPDDITMLIVEVMESI